MCLVLVESYSSNTKFLIHIIRVVDIEVSTALYVSENITINLYVLGKSTCMAAIPMSI